MKGLFAILLVGLACSITKAQSSLSLVPDTFSVIAQLVYVPVPFSCWGPFATVRKCDALKTLFSNKLLNIIIPNFRGSGDNCCLAGKHYQLSVTTKVDSFIGRTDVTIPKNYDKKTWFVLQKATLLD